MAKILIVDDLPTEVEVMRATLRGMGHDCVVATDGLQAVELARKEKPDLILLDIVLPRMDGFQACRKIRKDGETAGIPIILVSSKTQESDKFWGLKQGANDYLCKPFAPDQLKEAVKTHLGGAK